jgi:hypothetical protein
VLRILKIITPLKCVIPLYDGFIVQPEEGELHRRYLQVRKKVNLVAWSLNIDEGVKIRGLKLLWDATDILSK